MSSIRTGIELQDSFSPVLENMVSTVSEAVQEMEQMQQVMNAGVDTGSMDHARADIDAATASARELAETLAGISAPVINIDQPVMPDTVVPNQPRLSNDQLANPPPVINVPEEMTVPVTPVVTEQPEINVQDQITVPVTPVVTEQPEITVEQPDMSGVQQYQQQIQVASAALQQVRENQDEIITAGQQIDVIPADTRSEINATTVQIEQMQQALNQIEQNSLNVDSETTRLQIEALNKSLADTLQTQEQLSAQLKDMSVPVEWQQDFQIFQNTGIERFNAEVQSAQQMLNTLNTTQQKIEQTASGLDILPDGATQDISQLGQRLQFIQQRIQQISTNRMNIGSDRANAELEQLRSQLYGMVQAQEDLNAAIDSANPERINAAYLQLSGTIRNTEGYIRDNVGEQGQFNQAIQTGVNNSNNLVSAIKGAVAAYVSIQTVRKALDMSDELTMTTARLDMMNGAFNEINGTVMETQSLMNLVYQSAQNARGSFSDMANVVAKFGNNARDAFSSQEEVVAFANLIQKQMSIAGASTAEASNAMLQLSQALGSGVLRGDELNSIFEQAPNLIQSIADYLEVPIGEIRAMAQEGQLSADVVKAAIFAASDDINAKFNQMPMTWNQVWTAMSNTAVMQFQPVLNKINELANNQQFQDMLIGIMNGLAQMALILMDIMEFAGQVAAFFQDNWSVIEPIVMGIVTALGAYAVISGVVAVANGIHAASEATKAAAQMMATGATFAETAAQYGLNAALAACPITWIILAVIALIAAIIAVCQWIANTTDAANSAFGVICGGIATVGAFFKNLGLLIANVASGVWNWIKAVVTNIGIAFQNLGLSVANIALGIWAAIGAVCENIGTAFHNVIANVTGWWYGLLSDILSVIAGIAAALNKLPFVEFDYSGVADAASEYAAKSAAAYESTEDYTSLLDAFQSGMNTYQMKDYVDTGAAFDAGMDTFDAFQDGWASDAFQAGAAWGDGVSESVSDFFSGFDLTGGVDGIDTSNMFTGGGYSYDGYDASQIPANIADTAGNTAAVAGSLDVTKEELKYLRDIAEQEAINRYTTAEIHIEQTNNNNISSEMDLDGVVDGLTNAVNEAVDEITEGVHD